MGTWDHGILDNDTALDGIGDLQHGIIEDLVGFGAAAPTAASTGKLCAATGVLLQLSAYAFDFESDSGVRIAAAARAHAAAIAALPADARRVMEAVIAGDGKSLAERKAPMSAAHIALLHHAATASPFGVREPALFATPAGADYVQELAGRAIESIDADFEDESNWSDLCREGVGMGLLGVLMVLEPCTVPASKLAHWRDLATRGIAALRERADEELAFHELYYANLDRVFGVLLERLG